MRYVSDDVTERMSWRVRSRQV